VPVEMVQFLPKFLWKQNFCYVPLFPLIASSNKIVNSQTSFMLC